MTCPHCGRQDRQVKAGITGGVQRYKCMLCGRRYSLDTRPRAYAPSLRDRAAEMHTGGKSIRQIARELEISPQTVSNWIRTMPAPDPSAEPSPPPSEQPIRPRHTIADVAKHAGVSTSTVSNYLNDKGRMSHDTRQRIGDAMKALYFTPNALVRAIRNRRTHTLGLLTYGIYELEENVEFSIVAPILSAINRAADAANYDVLLYTGWPHRARSRTGSDFLNGQIDGLLFMSPQVDNQQIRIAAAGGLPVVSLLSRRVPAGAGYVVADNVGSIRETVLYLVGRGHKRIALLAATFTSDFLDRIAGYREGLAAAGIAHDSELEWTQVRPEQWSEAGVFPVVDRWLSMPNRPTAIIAVDDTLASVSVDRVRERGLRVPQDVAVTGFNDLPSAERMSGGITSVHQPLRDIGRIAVERLVAMINGAPISECRVTLPTTLVVRASTEA